MGKKDGHRNQYATALLAMMVVGMFESHEFYIGNATAGAVHLIALCAAALLSSSIGIQPTLAFAAIFPRVEGIICALKTDAQFDEQYGPSGSGSLSPSPAAS